MKYSIRNKIALFLLATILFMQSVLFPITTYASKNTAEDAQRAAQEVAEAGAELATNNHSGTEFDGSETEHNYDPTYMRWVGTEERACLLVYLVDYNTGDYSFMYPPINKIFFFVLRSYSFICGRSKNRSVAKR